MSPERPPRSLSGYPLFLTGVNGVVLNSKVLDMPRGISVRSLKSRGALEVSHLLGVSRESSKESKRLPLVPDWSQWCCSQYKRTRYA